MGIPKFYRWLSERYPLISAPIEPGFVPDFDNLYLDMNGIIHNCTHPEWNDNYLNRLTEKEMTFAIFQYIDKLFQTIKPRKLIYMAIDGSAPRAKMNQQRQRRFRAAQESREALAIAKEKGQKVPDEEDLFDSNCITPGTEFMARLSDSLKYFVRAKIRDDVAWRKVKVIFSGHETPGEGEHKIMEYIRIQKNQPDYEPNQKHCLYGLDADLIMLSLVSHEPHFALLREEVVFGRKNKRAPETPTTFQLLYINLLREYLEEEFRMELPFGWDLERVIDDFVLMCFFVGNDFLPELPYMDIAEGALDKMFEIYKEALPTLGGYITTSGEIDLARCEKFIALLAKHEQEMLAMMPSLHLEVLEHSVLRSSNDYYDDSEDEDSEEDTMGSSRFGVGLHLGAQEGEKRKAEEKVKEEEDKKEKEASAAAPAGGSSSNNSKEPSGEKEVDEVEAALAELEGDEKILIGGVGQTGAPAQPEEKKLAQQQKEEEASRPKDSATKQEDDDESEEEEDDGVWRNWYYRDKFRVGLENEEFHRSLRRSYLEGLCWVLKYYYFGCVSWSWFYPYHYAPLATDLTDIKDIEVKFELGTPFHPFEQLMGVLPPFSKRLLPRPYQELMTNVSSPIIDYYPLEFKVDMNGKRNPWEGIALIPFIDQQRLLDALNTIPAEKLTADEQRRNSFGKAHIFVYDPKETGTYPSPVAAYFDDLSPCQTTCDEWVDPPCPGGYKPPTLLPGVRTGLQGPPGFPTLKVLPFTSTLAYISISLFGMNSRKPSLLLKLGPKKPPKAETPAAGPEATAETSEKDKEKEKEKEKETEKETEKEKKPEKRKGSAKEIDSADIITGPDVAREMLGKAVFISYPYLREAIVLGVSDAKCRVSQSQGVVQHTSEDAAVWQKEIKYQAGKYKSKKGIDLGPVQVMLHVQPLKGMKVNRDGSRTKVFATSHEIVPYQAVVNEHPSPDPKLQEQSATALDEAFPIGKTVIYLGPGPTYGGLATVVDHVSRNVPHKKPKIKLDIELPPPLATFGTRIAAQMQERYYHLSEVSRKLNISPKVLSKVTASVYTQYQNRKINIGLRIKFTRKMQQVLGFTQRIETHPATDSSYGKGYWMLSAKAFELVRAFKENFPDLFESMEREDAQEVEVFTPEMLFPKGNHVERMEAVDKWLRALETSNLPRVPCGSKSMSAEAIKAVEEESNKYIATMAKRKVKTVSLITNTNLLISPLLEAPSQDSPGLPFLGERVMNIRGNGAIPFGLQGTVVGIIDGLLEVVFDKEFIGGINLGHRCSDLRGQKHIPYSAVLSLSGSTAAKMRNVNYHQATTAQQPVNYKNPNAQAPRATSARTSQPQQLSGPQSRAQAPAVYIKKNKDAPAVATTTTAAPAGTTTPTPATTATHPPGQQAAAASPGPKRSRKAAAGGAKGAPTSGDKVVYRPKQPAGATYVQKQPVSGNGTSEGPASTTTTTFVPPTGVPPSSNGEGGDAGVEGAKPDEYDPIAYWNSLQPQQQPPRGQQQPQQQQHPKKKGQHPQKRGQQQGQQQQPFLMPPHGQPAFGLPGYFPPAPGPYGAGLPAALFMAGAPQARGFSGPFPAGGITIPPELYQGGGGSGGAGGASNMPTPQGGFNWQQQALLGMPAGPATTTTTTTTPAPESSQPGGSKKAGGGSGRGGRGGRRQGPPAGGGAPGSHQQHPHPQHPQQPQQAQWKQRGAKQGNAPGGGNSNNPQPPHQGNGPAGGGGSKRGGGQHKKAPRQQQQHPSAQQGQQPPQQGRDAKDELTWQQKLLFK